MADFVIVRKGGPSFEGGTPTPPGNCSALSVQELRRYQENGKTFVELGLKGTVPAPLGTFKGNHVYEERPDGSDPLAPRKAVEVWSPDDDPVYDEFAPRDCGKFTYSADSAFLAVFAVEKPNADVTIRIYAPSFSTQIDNALVAANLVGASPSCTFPLKAEIPVSVGQEYCGLVTNPSITVKRVQVGGVIWAKCYLTYTKPAGDPRFTGVRVMAYRKSDMQLLSQGGQFNETSDTDVAGGVWPSPAESWVFRILSYSDPAGIAPSWESALVNTYVAGVTPEVEVSVGDANGSLDLAKASPESLKVAAFAAGQKPIQIVSSLPTDFTNYPPNTVVLLSTDKKLYKSTGGAWVAAAVSDPVLLNYAAIGILAAGAVATEQLATTELIIGAQTGKCPRFRVNDSLGNMIAFIGTDALGNKFNWFQDIRIGPDINNPTIYGSGSGVAINGATFSLTTGSVTTELMNSSSVLWGTIGLKIATSVNYKSVMSFDKLVFTSPDDTKLWAKITAFSGGRLGLGDENGSESVVLDGYSTSRGLYIGGDKVVGPRQFTPSTTGRTAGASYTANEQSMINELKAAVNDIITKLGSASGHGLWT